ncbi:hypothetical protein BG261_05500 [Floricoccus tropicus]|uniref:Uncharacterized protein n=1 Tax=Floricoccus tropicus TaxID=1859473 RepID=A0A1E8GKR3_9LACT|nr:hypothetical protein [Floricoccus tropicus]OFI48845.1 hypothetical protein BG261_05500 [Floricoccus tropicus]
MNEVAEIINDLGNEYNYYKDKRNQGKLTKNAIAAMIENLKCYRSKAIELSMLSDDFVNLLENIK